ncbi:MAG TPA: hypothetical protein VFZ65_11835, partial [Planctomycetota bacterium]|nr:hypothetical protein [Planctomycetota bacterium]
MPPTLPFAAPPNNLLVCNDQYAAGNAHNAALGQMVSTNQWDGIVGRVSSPRNAVAVTLDFHSIVGGGNDDVLLGISEVDRDRFAVVGATRDNASGLNSVFPLTRPLFTGTTPVCFATSPGLGLGVVMVFDAGPTRNNQALALLGSTLIGSPNGQTVARDVLFHGGL